MAQDSSFKDLTIWTIGHSTRTEVEFIALLAESGIGLVADVRIHPGSRRLPRFNADAMREWLGAAEAEPGKSGGIGYEHFPKLGGHRKARPDSRNTRWRNASFRGYADYMETEPYRAGAARLVERARQVRTAFMCAEAVWWQCHRSLIADDLKARGATVLHIMGPGKVDEHPYTSAARMVAGRLSYEAEPDETLFA